MIDSKFAYSSHVDILELTKFSKWRKINSAKLTKKENVNENYLHKVKKKFLHKLTEEKQNYRSTSSGMCTAAHPLVEMFASFFCHPFENGERHCWKRRKKARRKKITYISDQCCFFACKNSPIKVLLLSCRYTATLSLSGCTFVIRAGEKVHFVQRLFFILWCFFFGLSANR